MFTINLRSGQSIYEQLVNNIKEMILTGALKEDEKLPSVRELSNLLTVNPNTIQKSYRILEERGYIYTIRGRGNFVMPAKYQNKEEKIIDLKNGLEKVIKEANFIGLSQDEMIQMVMELYGDIKKDREDEND
jgi:GntR family transcriptional regulator